MKDKDLPLVVAEMHDAVGSLVAFEEAHKDLCRCYGKLANWFDVDTTVTLGTTSIGVSVKPAQRLINLIAAIHADSGDLDVVERATAALGFEHERVFWIRQVGCHGGTVAAVEEAGKAVAKEALI